MQCENPTTFVLVQLFFPFPPIARSFHHPISLVYNMSFSRSDQAPDSFGDYLKSWTSLLGPDRLGHYKTACHKSNGRCQEVATLECVQAMDVLLVSPHLNYLSTHNLTFSKGAYLSHYRCRSSNKYSSTSRTKAMCGLRMHQFILIWCHRGLRCSDVMRLTQAYPLAKSEDEKDKHNIKGRQWDYRIA